METTENFTTTTGLRQLGMGAPVAAQKIVFVMDPADQKNVQHAEQYMGVWNEASEKLSCIASKKYHIVQHRDVLENLANVLQDLNLSVRGKIEYFNDGDEMQACVLFNDHMLTDDSKDGVMLGLRVVNSYNCSKGFRGDIYALRLVCSNGMVLPVFENGVYKRIHVGEFDASEGIATFIKRVIELKPQFQELIEKNIRVELEKETWHKIVEKLVKQKKHRDEILQRINMLESEKLTKWDVYNVFTDYVSHTELARWATEYFTDMSADILQTPVEVLAKVQ